MMRPEFSVLANSMPRGGPFLLTSALQLLGYRKYAGADRHGTPAAFNYQEAIKALQGRPGQPGEGMVGISPFAPCYVGQARMHEWLSVLAGDEYIMAHLPLSAALPVALQGLNCRHLVIIRDPRSLLLSLLFDTHPMPRFLIEPFAGLPHEQQLNFMLSGGTVPGSEMTLSGFAEVYRSMSAWLDRPDCLVVRFENLIGLNGGGSLERQQTELEKMAAFLELDIDTPIYERLDTIDDTSLTLCRNGYRDNWETVVSNEIIERIAAVCEPLTVEAGYTP